MAVLRWQEAVGDALPIKGPGIQAGCMERNSPPENRENESGRAPEEVEFSTRVSQLCQEGSRLGRSLPLRRLGDIWVAALKNLEASGSP